MPQNPPNIPFSGEDHQENRDSYLGNLEGRSPGTSPKKEEGRFSGISRERWLELARHVAEIQQYQREHGLEDKGDPPPDNRPSFSSTR